MIVGFNFSNSYSMHIMNYNVIKKAMGAKFGVK